MGADRRGPEVPAVGDHPPDDLRFELATDLPAGEVLGGAGVDAAFTGDDWRATAYLLPATGDVVVLGIDD
ncbi:hypothetical protein [Gordonia sp. NPDC003950]